MDRNRASSPVTLQQLVGAAERLARKVPDVSREQWLGLVDDVRDRLAVQPFSALPLDAFTVQSGGKLRQITMVRNPDRLLEEALLPRVVRRLETRLSGAAHGYRRGRSTLTAALAASQVLGRGRVFVAALDIANFYPSIDRLRLAKALEELFDPPLVQIVNELISAPVLDHGRLTRPVLGIPLGRALSPVLSNLYLLPLDTAADRDSWTYLRYADDLLLLAESEQVRTDAEKLVTEELVKLGLHVRPEKSRYHHYQGSPIQYLGYTLDSQSIYERVTDRRLERIAIRSGQVEGVGEQISGEASDAEEVSCLRSHTLYVTEQRAYLRYEQGQIVIQRGPDTTAEIPMHRVDRVLILTGVGMSSGFISACITQNVPVLFFVGKGRAYGSLVAEGMPNPLRLRAQYDLLSDVSRKTDVARAIVRAKLRAMLKRLRGVSQAADQRARLRALTPSLESAPDAAALRGVEGMATRIYYEGYAKRLTRPGFRCRLNSEPERC